MKKRNGGYLMVDLTSTNLVERLNIAYTSGKPVLVYDENGKADFYTLTLEDETFVLSNANYVYKIDSEGTISKDANTPTLYCLHGYYTSNSRQIMGTITKQVNSIDELKAYLIEKELTELNKGIPMVNVDTGQSCSLYYNATENKCLCWSSGLGSGTEIKQITCYKI